MSVPAKSSFAAINALVTPETTGIAPLAEAPKTPYAGFYSPKNKVAADIVADIPGIVEGTPIYFNGKRFKKLDPFRFLVIKSEQFFVKYAGINPCSVKKLDKAPPFSDPYKDNIETVIFILDEGKAIPANCSFRTTKAGAMRKALQAIDSAATPEWAKLSDDHKMSMSVPTPALRVVVNGTLEAQTSKSSGLKSYILVANPKPTTAADFKILNDSAETQEFKDLLEQANAAYDRRCKQLRDLIGK